jgi:hypothetical protein
MGAAATSTQNYFGKGKFKQVGELAILKTN